MKKRLVSLFVENVPRKEVPAGYSRFSVIPNIDERFPHRKNLVGLSGCHSPLIIAKLSHIAERAEVNDTVTREELMRAYDLVEQGYTLWFGGDCPVDGDVCVSHVVDNGYVGEKTLARMIAWSSPGVIAYKIVEPCTGSSKPDATTITGQFIERDGDKFFFTPEEVVSVAKQIQSGDLLTTKHGTTVEVLYIGKTNVFLRDLSSGEEFSASHLDVLEFYDY